MTYAAISVWMPVLAVFLSGAVAGVFVMLVIGIRRGDRAHHLAGGLFKSLQFDSGSRVIPNRHQ